jgi:hypothetical protein
MPYIVLIIDELADFMMKYPKEMESGIVKLAQMSRAVGIHLDSRYSDDRQPIRHHRCDQRVIFLLV